MFCVMLLTWDKFSLWDLFAFDDFGFEICVGFPILVGQGGVVAILARQGSVLPILGVLYIGVFLYVEGRFMPEVHI